MYLEFVRLWMPNSVRKRAILGDEEYEYRQRWLHNCKKERWLKQKTLSNE